MTVWSAYFIHIISSEKWLSLKTAHAKSVRGIALHQRRVFYWKGFNL